MAQKATSVYVSIVDNKTHVSVVTKKFFNSKSANEFIKENLEKYPKETHYFHKEVF